MVILVLGDVLDVFYQSVTEKSSGKVVGHIHTIGPERIGWESLFDKE